MTRLNASGPILCLAAAGAAAAGGPGPTPTFVEIAADLGIDVTHATSGYNHANYTGGGAVGDFDNNGCQDLYVISGGNGNQRDWLFMNNCDGTFTESGIAWGLAGAHYGKGASVGDYDNDGWLDIYVTSAGPFGTVAPGRRRERDQPLGRGQLRLDVRRLRPRRRPRPVRGGVLRRQRRKPALREPR